MFAEDYGAWQVVVEIHLAPSRLMSQTPSLWVT